MQVKAPRTLVSIRRNLMPGCPVHFNPLVSPHLEDPYPVYARARQSAPVFFSPIHDAWVVTRYDDVLTILRDPSRFSSSHRFRQPVNPTPEVLAELAQLPPEVRLLVNEDPPGHRRTRSLVGKAFSPKQVTAMAPRVHAIAHELIDRFEAAGHADLVQQYTYPLPMRVLLEFVGLPVEDADFIKQWCQDHILLAVPGISAAQQLQSARTEVAFRRYADALIAERRHHPQADLLSALIHVELDGERPLDDAELNSLLQQMLFAGHETTTNLLSNTLFQLLRAPDLWQALRADPSFTPNAVEEGLRHDAAIPGMFRTATQDVIVAGVAIPAGARLFLSFASANRDERLFATPEDFELRRFNADKHLSFGHGIHFCLGATLARLEAHMGIEVLLQRVPDLRLVPGQHITYLPSLLNRALQHLYVRWGSSLQDDDGIETLRAGHA
jgi:cytochrome P450